MLAARLPRPLRRVTLKPGRIPAPAARRSAARRQRPAGQGRLGQRASGRGRTAVGVRMETEHGGEKMTGRTIELPHDEPDEAPEGFREQPRYAPAVERAYANDRI